LDLRTHWGFALSGIGHAAIVAVVLGVLAHPRLWDATTPPVMIDIVPESEIAKPKPDPPREQEKEAQRPDDAAPRPRAAQSQPDGAQAATSAPWPDANAGQPAWPATSPANPATSSFLTLNLPGMDALEFDTPADAAARLAPEEIEAFQARLQQCWHPPAGMAGATKLRAMVRIALTPAGALAREPLLIRASASAQGPRLVQTATRALQECQPFTFLPAEKYQEWKLLDLTFSPQGLEGS